MFESIEQIHKTPDLHFSICSSNKDIFRKFEKALRQNGMIGIPDLQGNIHYIVDGRKGFPTAYKKVKDTTLKLMEEKIDNHTSKIQHAEAIADFLIEKYEFDKALIGTKFMRHMVIYGLLDKSLLLSFSKYLYPTIGKLFSIAGNKVGYCTRYSLRKLEEYENQQRKNNVKKDYLLPLNESYSNRSALQKLIAEAEMLLTENRTHYSYYNNS